MESCRINVVDVSCFLLFEASGDSEVDSDPNLAVAMANEDAESCSCDLSDYVRVNELIKGGDVQEYEDDDDYDNEGEEEVNSNFDKTGTGEEMGVPKFCDSKIMKGKREKKSRVCVDKSKEVMNEMEKNTLF